MSPRELMAAENQVRTRSSERADLSEYRLSGENDKDRVLGIHLSKKMDRAQGLKFASLAKNTASSRCFYKEASRI